MSTTSSVQCTTHSWQVEMGVMAFYVLLYKKYH